MKKIFTLWTFLCLVTGLRAQTQAEFARTPQGQPVVAPCTDYRHYCSSLSFSPDKRQMLVLLNATDKGGRLLEDGSMVLYNIGDTVPVWSRGCKVITSFTSGGVAVDIGPRFQTRFTPYGILMAEGSKYALMGMDGTTKIWEQKIYPVWVSDTMDVMIGYASPTSSRLMALRISTGEKLWEHKSSHNVCWGWKNVTKAGDGLLVVVNDAIELINPLMGMVRQFKAHTGLSQTGKTLLMALAAGVALGAVGAATGYIPYYIPGVNGNTLTSTSSPALYADGRCYVSDRDSLYCFSTEGTAVWSQTLPRREAGNARLVLKGDTLLLLNYAFGLQGGRRMKSVGRPFVMAVDKTSGQQFYLRYLLDEDRKAMVEGAYVGKKGAFLMMNDHLAYKPLADSSLTVKPWNVTAYGEMTWMPSDTVYTFRLNDEQLTPLPASDSLCVVETSKGLLKVVNRQLDVVDDFQSSNLYRQFIPCGPCRVVSTYNEEKGYDYWIVRADGMGVAHVTVPVNKMMFAGHTLYILSSEKVYAVDVNRL